MNHSNEHSKIAGHLKRRFSLREYIGALTIVMLAIGLVATTQRLRLADKELNRLHDELGYLAETPVGQIAAVRAPCDQPLTYKVRIRVPSSPKFRVSYSSVLNRDSTSPSWYGAVPVPSGESTLTVRIHEDPRDHQWKLLVMVVGQTGTRRMATVLPKDHTAIFRGSHEVVATGIGRQTFAADAGASIRLLDERWLVGDGGLLLYGDRPPDHDQIGIYAELQPDTGTL